jgi:hypothetical protein
MPLKRPRSHETAPDAAEYDAAWARDVFSLSWENVRHRAFSTTKPAIADLRSKGHSLQAIADELNAQGQTTRSGKPWNRMQVSRVLKRIGDTGTVSSA